jgi:predicted transcriptional regulator
MSDRQEIQEIVLSTQVPQTWAKKLEVLAEQTGRSLTELVREAVAQYLGVEEQKYSEVKLEQVEAELVLLKQKVAELEPYKAQVATILMRLAVIEQAIAQDREPINISQTFSAATSWSANMQALVNDDIDDEPDEILIDFLPDRF